MLGRVLTSISKINLSPEIVLEGDSKDSMPLMHLLLAVITESLDWEVLARHVFAVVLPGNVPQM